MKVIFEEVSDALFLTAIFGSVFSLFLLYLIRFIRSTFDPAIVTLFQITFTFFILVGSGLAYAEVWISYVVFFVTIVFFRKVSIVSGTLFTIKEWQMLTTIFIVISIFTNVILVYKKGFILFHPNPSEAKLVYYQGFGIFKRINEIAAPLCGVAALYLLYEKRLGRGILLLLYTSFLLISSGAKSGLISMVFFVGAFYHFYDIKISRTKIFLLGLAVLTSVLSLFYWIYKDRFLEGFYNRMVAFADGPYYYYAGNLQDRLNYSPDYALDQFLVSVRLRSELRYISLGPAINREYFHHKDELTGPNPQFSVEAQAMFGTLFFLYPFIIGMTFAVLRRTAATPFALIILSLFFNPLPIDSQYAFSNIVTLLVLLSLISFVKFFSVKIKRAETLET